MPYWIVPFSVAFDYTSTLKCVFLFYSEYTTALICLWNNGHMPCIVRVSLSNCYVNKRCLWKKKKLKSTLWHYEDYNIYVVLFRKLFFILLYNGSCVQLFFVLYFASLLFIFDATINIRSWEKYNTLVQYCI